MSLVKSPVFQVPNSVKAAPADRQPAESLEPAIPVKQSGPKDSSSGFVSRMMEGAGAARGYANALRTHTQLAVACVQSGLDATAVAQLAAETTLKTLEQMGYSTEAPTENVERAMPSVCRAVTESLTKLMPRTLTAVNEASTHAILNKMEQGGDRLAKALGGISRNAFLSKFANKQFPSDLDAKGSLTLTAIASMATMAVYTERFNFYLGPSKAMKHANDTIAKAFAQRADEILQQLPGAASTQTRVMALQSLYSSMTELYQSCWASEARRTMLGIKRAMMRNHDRAEIEEHVKGRIKLVDSAFEAKVDDVMQWGVAANAIAEMASQLVSAKRTARQADRPSNA